MAFPNGHEKGRFLTIDMGGTNLRICDVELSAGKRDFEQTQRKFKLPPEIKTGTGKQLWDFVAEKVESFLQEQHQTWQADGHIFSLAFTFSFPVDQRSIKVGILQGWTKNFDVSDVEGHDVIPQLEEAFSRRVCVSESFGFMALIVLSGQKLPVRVVALINDTTGTLIASRYRDPQVKIGSIFSTGVNAAYMEDVRDIPKLDNCGLPENARVIINTEYGAFDNERQVLPLTPLDRQLDEQSLRPGTQMYEKMVSGLYIGEMMRLILVTLYEEGKLFEGLDITRLRKENALEASFLSVAEMDITEGLQDMREEFEESLSLSPKLQDLKICRYLIGLVATRAARLYACGIAAICKKKSIHSCHVGVDGSVFNKYSGFKSRAGQALREIFSWPPGEVDKIVLNASEDGSGVGAALAAALVLGEQSAKPVSK